MKKNWWFITSAWTGTVVAFFGMFLSLVVIPNYLIECSPFEQMLAEVAGSVKGLFPIALYNAFMIITMSLCALSVSFLVLDTFKLLFLHSKKLNLIKIIFAATLAVFGLVVMIFGCVYAGTLNEQMGNVQVGASPFVVFMGALICSGAVIINYFFTRNDYKQRDEFIEIVAEMVNTTM